MEKDVLINIPNPQYEVMINQFQYLKGIQMNDTETKSVDSIDIHIFRDNSLIGTSAIAYAIVNQPSGTEQGLLTSKSRLSSCPDGR